MTSRLLFGLLLIGSALSSCGNGSPASTSSMPRHPAAIATPQGKELFQRHCAPCHGIYGNYRNNNAADLSLTRLDSAGIAMTIYNGRGAMPMFAHTFNDSEYNALINYVMSLRKY